MTNLKGQLITNSLKLEVPDINMSNVDNLISKAIELHYMYEFIERALNENLMTGNYLSHEEVELYNSVRVKIMGSGALGDN